MAAVPLSKYAVQLRPEDNLAVAARDVPAGTQLQFEGGTVTVPTMLLIRSPPPRVMTCVAAALGPPFFEDTYCSPNNVMFVANPFGKSAEFGAAGRNQSTVAPTELLVPNVTQPIAAPLLL